MQGPRACGVGLGRSPSWDPRWSLVICWLEGEEGAAGALAAAAAVEGGCWRLWDAPLLARRVMAPVLLGQPVGGRVAGAVVAVLRRVLPVPFLLPVLRVGVQLVVAARQAVLVPVLLLVASVRVALLVAQVPVAALQVEAAVVLLVELVPVLRQLLRLPSAASCQQPAALACAQAQRCLLLPAAAPPLRTALLLLMMPPAAAVLAAAQLVQKQGLGSGSWVLSAPDPPAAPAALLLPAQPAQAC